MIYSVATIAIVVDGRPTPDDDHWGGTTCQIRLTDAYDAEALAGLDAFSHLEIVYLFDRVSPDAVETTARHPRDRDDWPLLGIFAQRGKRRPNRIGVSRCRLLRIDGKQLTVEGLDAMDGTPVLDIKPWVDEFGPRGHTIQPEWMTELMADYYASGKQS